MKFFEIFKLKGEKKRLKYIRYETEEMTGHVQSLVESYQSKIKSCTELTGAWPRRDYSEIAKDCYAFKTHMLQGHEHTKQLMAKSEELIRFLDETIHDEKMLQHARLEMHMKSLLNSMTDLCKSLDHVFVQEALFFQEESERIFSQHIQHLVILVQQEVSLYEHIHNILDEIDLANQNIRERLKHERYVEEEYETVSNSSYPQVRDNL